MIEHMSDCEDTITLLGDSDLEIVIDDDPTLVDLTEPCFPPPSAPRPWLSV
jgi:hypothetical protein